MGKIRAHIFTLLLKIVTSQKSVIYGDHLSLIVYKYHIHTN